MKRTYFVIFVIISLLLTGCFMGKTTENIGVVTDSKTDQEAIEEVITAYFKAIKNYTWKDYDKNKGLEFWTEEGKKDLLEDPKKLPNLERSIKENKINRELIKSNISNISIDGNSANIEAETLEKSTSINPVFNGNVQSSEEISLVKMGNTWLINERNAQIIVIQSE